MSVPSLWRWCRRPSHSRPSSRQARDGNRRRAARRCRQAAVVERGERLLARRTARAAQLEGALGDAAAVREKVDRKRLVVDPLFAEWIAILNAGNVAGANDGA